MSNDFFTVVKVKELQPDDFYLGSRTPTMLKSRDTTLVLFYLPNDPESEELKDIWAALSTEVAGVDFAAVNGSRQSDIMKAFVETGGDPDHPLYPFKVNGFPTIMVFRDGWPQAYYNGDRNYDDLLAYCLELAWQVGYYEPNNDYVGVAPTRPDFVAYERRTSGDQYVSDYIEQLSERQPADTPEGEPGVLLDEAEAEVEEDQEEPAESEDIS
jgi:hypothetical protein